METEPFTNAFWYQHIHLDAIAEIVANELANERAWKGLHDVRHRELRLLRNPPAPPNILAL
jgi:hypothetical protein